MSRNPPQLHDAVAITCQRLGYVYATTPQHLHVTRSAVATASPLEHLIPV